MDDAFGNWLAGFMDGEACFYINCDTRRGTNYQCAVRLALRDDDAAIIEEIHRRTGFGNIGRSDWHARQRAASKPQVSWEVTSMADTQALVELLDRYPLRSKKARDFEIWRRAVEVRADTSARGELPGSRRGQKGGRAPYDWRRMAALKLELEQSRVYRAAA